MMTRFCSRQHQISVTNTTKTHRIHTAIDSLSFGQSMEARASYIRVGCGAQNLGNSTALPRIKNTAGRIVNLAIRQRNMSSKSRTQKMLLVCQHCVAYRYVCYACDAPIDKVKTFISAVAIILQAMSGGSQPVSSAVVITNWWFYLKKYTSCLQIYSSKSKKLQRYFSFHV